MSSKFRAILIDLFWTAVDMDFTNYPRLREPFGKKVAETVSDADVLYETAKSHGFQGSRNDFLHAYFTAREAVTKAWDEGETEEVTSERKFSQLLEQLDFSSQDLARKLTRLHMKHIVEATFIPAPRREFLKKISGEHRIALVSNFDHAPSGYEILERHEIVQCFHEVVISDEIGKRKPHPLPFQKAMDQLGVKAHETLMVGDSPLADVKGARDLGIETIWVQTRGETWPSDLEPADHTVSDLSKIDFVLRRK